MNVSVRRQHLLLLFAVLAGAPHAAAEESPQDVLKALRAWRERFATIEVVYTSTNRPSIEARFPQAKDVADLHGVWCNRIRWAWADFGGYLNDLQELENAAIVYRSMGGGTTSQSFAATSKRGVEQSQTWEQISTSISSKPSGWVFITVPVYPIMIGTRNLWLNEVLDSAGDSIEWLPPDSFKGHRCRKFRARFRDDRMFAEEYWLDEAHGFLPRRVVTLDFELEYETEEFFEPEPGFWFPAKGLFGQPRYEDRWEGRDWKSRNPSTD